MSTTNKMKELILYVASKSKNDVNFGATKLNKILFYSDFLAYLNYGKAITGETYQKLKNGPAPRCFMPLRREMIANKEAILRRKIHFGYTIKKLFALREPDTSSFKAKEIALVDELICEFEHKTAAEISDDSHDFIGWQLAGLREDIPYECVLVGTGNLTTEEREYGKGLQSLALQVLGRN